MLIASAPRLIDLLFYIVIKISINKYPSGNNGDINTNKLKVLVLNSERFMNDLRPLSKQDNLSLFFLSSKNQARLNSVSSGGYELHN